MPSSDEGQEESEQGVFCGAHLPEEAPPFGRGASLKLKSRILPSSIARRKLKDFPG
jgi:hypothetical protein